MIRKPSSGLAALLLAGLVSQLGYALLQPLLPALLKAADAPVQTHTGLLTASYALGLALCAPMWGALADRRERGQLLVIGLAGLTLCLSALSFVAGLAALYAGLFLAGGFSAAIFPVALVLVADWFQDERQRALYLGWFYAAVSTGLLAGPAVGGYIGALASTARGATSIAFLTAAGLAGAATSWAWLTVPRAPPPASSMIARQVDRSALRLLLTVAGITSWVIGTFEVGMTVRASSEFALGTSAIAQLFVQCMVIMILAQLAVFNAVSRPAHSRLLLAPVFALLAASVLLLGFGGSVPAMASGAAGIAAAAAALSTITGYWVSLAAGRLCGAAFGRQLAIVSLGQAFGAGSAAALLSYPVTGAAFIVASLLAAAGAAVSMSVLSRRLARLDPGAGPAS